MVRATTAVLGTPFYEIPEMLEPLCRCGLQLSECQPNLKIKRRSRVKLVVPKKQDSTNCSKSPCIEIGSENVVFQRLLSLVDSDGIASRQSTARTASLIPLFPCKSHLFLHSGCPLLRPLLHGAVLFRVRPFPFPTRNFGSGDIRVIGKSREIHTNGFFGGSLEPSATMFSAASRTMSRNFWMQSWRFALMNAVLFEVVSTASEPRI